MSYTTYGLNDALAVKLFSKMLSKAERDSLDIAPLQGKDQNSIIQVKDEASRGAGDKITFGLRARPSAAGFTESETAEGNGESLTTYSDAIFINELGYVAASRSANTIDAQRVPFDLRQECKNANADWWVDRKSVSFFNQVCGYKPAAVESSTSGTKWVGLNAVTDAAGATGLVRQIWAGSATNDEGLTSSDGFVLSLIDRAVEAARSGSRMIRPVKIGGQPKYVVYLSEGQVTSMRTNAGTGGWQDITKFTFSGVDTSKNPLYSGALGEYNQCILRRSQDVTRGMHHTTFASDADTRRAVLLGAQAAMCAYGRKDYGPNKYRWNEELLDHKRKLEVSSWSVWGLKKAIFNSVDHGCMVLSTYSLT